LAAHYLKYGFILSYFDGAVNLQIRRGKGEVCEKSGSDGDRVGAHRSALKENIGDRQKSIQRQTVGKPLSKKEKRRRF
jgi:hypothetical protein